MHPWKSVLEIQVQRLIPAKDSDLYIYIYIHACVRVCVYTYKSKYIHTFVWVGLVRATSAFHVIGPKASGSDQMELGSAGLW